MRRSSASLNLISSTLIILLLIFITFQCVLADSSSLPPMFSSPDASSAVTSTTYTSTLASSTTSYITLTFLILLPSLFLFLLTTLYFSPSPREFLPLRGAQVKYNVVTGEPALRERRVMSEKTQDVQHGRTSNLPTCCTAEQILPPCCLALGECCENVTWNTCRGVICCACCQCGGGNSSSKGCCGSNQPSLREWTFHYLYRAHSVWWLTLLFHATTLAMGLFAVLEDKWSQVEDYNNTNISLYVGLTKLYTSNGSGDDLTYTSACSGLTGIASLQCWIFRVSITSVFALTVLSIILSGGMLILHLSLLCKGRLATLRMWEVSMTQGLVMCTIVLLYSLSTHILISSAYSSSLSLGPSWYALLSTTFILFIQTHYLRNQIEMHCAEESGNPLEIEAAQQQDLLYKSQVDELSNRNHVLILNEAELELQERRAEASTWTQDGYGQQQPFNPRLTASQLQASQFLSTHPPQFHLSRQQYFANDASGPSAHEMERGDPTQEEVRVQKEKSFQESREWQQTHLRRIQEREGLSGPFVNRPPKYVDRHGLEKEEKEEYERRKEREEKEREILELNVDNIGRSRGKTLNMNDLEDNGLNQRDLIRRSERDGPFDIHDDDDLPSVYTYHANSSGRPIRILTNREDATGLDAILYQNQNRHGHQGGGEEQNVMPLTPTPKQFEKPNTVESVASPSLKPAANPVNTSMEAEADDSDNESDDDEGEKNETHQQPTAVVQSKPLDVSQYNVLSSAYIRESLLLDDKDLQEMAAKDDEKNSKKKSKGKMPKKRKVVQRPIQIEQQANESSSPMPLAVGVTTNLQQQQPSFSSTMSQQQAGATTVLHQHDLTPAQYRTLDTLERDQQPNLLIPIGGGGGAGDVQQHDQFAYQQQQQYHHPQQTYGKQRLPPLQHQQQQPNYQYQPYSSQSFVQQQQKPQLPQYHYATMSSAGQFHPSQTQQQQQQHPFSLDASQSPQTGDPRVYHYEEQSRMKPSYVFSHHQQPSGMRPQPHQQQQMNSRNNNPHNETSEHDLHFSGTFGLRTHSKFQPPLEDTQLGTHTRLQQYDQYESLKSYTQGPQQLHPHSNSILHHSAPQIPIATTPRFALNSMNLQERVDIEQRGSPEEMMMNRTVLTQQQFGREQEEKQSEPAVRQFGQSKILRATNTHLNASQQQQQQRGPYSTSFGY